MWKVASVFFLLSAFLRMANAADIHVKLAPGATLIDIQDLGMVTPLFTLPIERLKELCEVEPGLPDLTLWYRVVNEDVASNDNVEEADLISLQEYIKVEYDGFITDVVIPKYAPPPNNTPDFTANQNYLLPNSDTDNGIDAQYSWTFPGGDGEGITIYDIEYAWNLQHEDLSIMHADEELVTPGDKGVDPNPDNAHGTAVLGEIVGTSNDFGVTGISPGAKARVAPENTEKLGSARANAIMLSVQDAMQDGIPNDVILLEMQTDACGLKADPETQEGYGPAEDDLTVFEATRVAVANGIVVVAAAGNGNVNLDDPLCQGKYDRTTRDSGAIIVGAGGSGRIGCSTARTKMDFSTFGSRVDVHGWGECVWTTGYGDGYKDPSEETEETKWYTAGFGGTSSASPFVAAAAANIQGIAMKAFGAPLKPNDLRKLLSDTGLVQLGDTSKHIGPLVNLRGAINKLLLDVSPRPTPTPTHSPTQLVPTTNFPTVNPTTVPHGAGLSKSSKQATKSSKSKLPTKKSKESK